MIAKFVLEDSPYLMFETIAKICYLGNRHELEMT